MVNMNQLGISGGTIKRKRRQLRTDGYLSRKVETERNGRGKV